MNIEFFIACFIVGSGLLITAICLIINHGRSSDRMLSGMLYRPDPPRTPPSRDPGTLPATGPVDRYRPS